MRVSISLLLFFVLYSFLQESHSHLTLPLGHMPLEAKVNHHKLKPSHSSLHIFHTMRNFQTTHHHNNLRSMHALEKQTLIPHGYYFTLALNVDGLDYNLNIDTGSSDLFVKG